MLQGAFSLLRNVDFTFLEPLDQVIWCQIDQLDGVGSVEHCVGHRLTHPDMRDLRNHVIEAFDVLNINGRVNVDAVAHQLFDIEEALGVPAPFSICVSEFVDQHDLRMSRNDGVDIHLA